MYRQLYMSGGIGSLDAGAPSIKYEGDIRPQMTSAPDPMDALNDLAMQLFGKPLDMLTPSERQALDEYNSGMMAVGGRVNYGIGSKLKKFAKKVIDPVAQVAAFIPGVHQPFAQGYTALRASGVGGDNYGGLQVLGMTPGAGQFQPYGQQVQPYGQQGGFRIQDFIPTFDATNPATGESIFGPGGKLKPNASTSSIFETGIGNKMKEIFNDAIYYPSKEEIEKKLPGKKVSQGLLDLVKKVFVGEDGKNIPNTTAATAGAVLAKLSYDQQKALEERLRGEYEAYQSGASRFRERMGDKSKLRGYEVTGVPRTVKDVVRAPAMGGGIMNTRMGYGSGSEDLEYKGWKKIYLKSNDAAESHPRHSEFIKRFAEETMGQDRSPEVRIKKALGGMGMEEPTSSFEQNTMMAGPDWYVKRVEILMELGYDYDTASEIAYDSDRYYDTVGGMNKGGRPGYALGDIATMAAQAEGLPLRNNQVGITELDLRDSGGFIPPVGIKEKADDIPAMLSNNEFVFTADAVRGMGDGDVDMGAQRMYDIMKKLEKGGRV
jgi:hypothetical protein